uniref:Uncharacterized protein n=1 Tax=Morchella brunnea TaxID=1174671 RepID=A0A8K1I7S4_9PEZI|nr:hypothetical protein LK370_mgp003 [Morchella brunnea]UBU98473.1 hypothetical protein [Morchella brunnea]
MSPISLKFKDKGWTFPPAYGVRSRGGGGTRHVSLRVSTPAPPLPSHPFPSPSGAPLPRRGKEMDGGEGPALFFGSGAPKGRPRLFKGRSHKELLIFLHSRLLISLDMACLSCHLTIGWYISMLITLHHYYLTMTLGGGGGRHLNESTGGLLISTPPIGC